MSRAGSRRWLRVAHTPCGMTIHPPEFMGSPVLGGAWCDDRFPTAVLTALMQQDALPPVEVFVGHGIEGS